MPRYLFHLHAGEGRANADNSGQHLPNLDAAREMARRIAGRLVAWNLEPVSWLDYQVHVTDEAGAIVYELPLVAAVGQNQAFGQSENDRLMAQTAVADASPKDEFLSSSHRNPARDTSPWLTALTSSRTTRRHGTEQRLEPRSSKGRQKPTYGVRIE